MAVMEKTIAKTFYILSGVFVIAFISMASNTSYAATKSKKPPVYTAKAASFLKNSAWRTTECGEDGNFQAFIFNQQKPQVEVGYGANGEGERLEMLNADVKGEFVEIETRVCAPVGCNHTYEKYKILGPNQIQEWSFIGQLPDNPPLVMVKDGIATNDNSKGRVFNRCEK